MTHPYNRERAEVNHVQKWVSIALRLFPCLLLQRKKIENDVVVSRKMVIYLVKSPHAVQPHQPPGRRDLDQGCRGSGKRRAQRPWAGAPAGCWHPCPRDAGQRGTGSVPAPRARCPYCCRVSGRLLVLSGLRRACSSTGEPWSEQPLVHVQPATETTSSRGRGQRHKHGRKESPPVLPARAAESLPGDWQLWRKDTTCVSRFPLLP